ncbi:Zn-dependent hydrolase [Veronia nyctiphanis]|uniref:Zn-dependent hydrolase n=1 Tax=Veronia nyctiphanis TaxID=1278244 RepID=A0A4Q0YUB4_9GAMM|nr:Zn-dependent hydrolase [Veronia nyctiphanis]
MALHKLDGYIQSIFLAEHTDGFMLLDGCSRPDVSLVISFIEQTLGRKKEDLKLVVVTHMHPDHAGGANLFRKLTGCKLAAANVSGQWYGGVSGTIMHWTDIALAQYVAKRKERPFSRIWYARTLSPDIKLEDGEKIPGFKEWTAHFTQGHTDRDLSLHHISSDRIYIADLIVKVKDKYFPPVPVSYPNRYKRSLEKLRQLGPKEVILAHGAETPIEMIDFDYLLQRAPNEPLTQWKVIWKNIHERLLFNMFKKKDRP